jgi:Tol biopolymer transport system component/DNA-binding winged helix-turn-helix (wHTH) protein
MSTGDKTNLAYEFGPFRLDPAERLLLRDGQAVALTPKAFDLLVYLVEHHGHLVEKQSLMTALWPDTIVEEANLAYNVSALRKALGDGREDGRFIETVPTRGYRFVARVTVSSTRPGDRGDEGVASKRSALTRRNRRAALAIAVVITLIGAAGVGLYRFLNRPRTSTSGSGAEPKFVPVTSLTGRESQPAFSPDGTQIAFVWEGAEENNLDIYVKLIDAGEPLRLTTNPAPDFSPVWSPDGRYIAFAREGEAAGIYLVPALGGAERKIGDIFPTGIYYRGAYHQLGRGTLSYSPDGKYLALADKTSATEPFSIFLLALETGERRRLTSPPAASVGDESPAFSPDGTTLALARLMGGAKDIYVVPAAGGEPKRLTFEDTVRPGSFTDGLAWTSDGREIVFASNRSGSFQLWQVPVAGGAPKRIDVYAQNLSQPTISRHGNRLAWIQTSYDTNIWRMQVPDPAGQLAAPKLLIASTAYDSNPQYSPDGQRIVFGSDRSGTHEIWVSDSEGRNPMPLTNMGGPVTGTPRWSPDGREIAFDSMVAANRDIYVVSSNGGKPRRLTTEPGEDTCPSWSRDGRWIYFGSSRSGSLQIWKAPSTGGPAVQVTRHGGFEGFESTDGKYFYYARGRDAPGIWRIAVQGGAETPVVDRHGAGFWRSWAVTDAGIYFASAEMPARPMLEFFDFAVGDTTRVAVLERPISARVWGLAVSPDRRWILYTQIDQSSSDIMLMQDFR